jgi:hypothetical protein
VTQFSDSVTLGPEIVDDTCAGPACRACSREPAPSRAGPWRGRVHVKARTTTGARIEFADGSYLLESQSERFVFNFTEPHSVLGGTTQAKGTLYDQNGATPTVEFHRFRLSCA